MNLVWALLVSFQHLFSLIPIQAEWLVHQHISSCHDGICRPSNSYAIASLSTHSFKWEILTKVQVLAQLVACHAMLHAYLLSAEHGDEQG